MARGAVAVGEIEGNGIRRGVKGLTLIHGCHA